MLQLPFIPSVPSYRVSTTLSGVVYIFDVRWNTRDEAWYFDLLTEDETVIRHGIKIVLGTILAGRVSTRLPRGAFIAADLSGFGRDAGLDDLGSRVNVYFYTLEEIRAFE